MEPKYIIDIHTHLHTHLHRDQDVEELINLSRKYNIRKICVLSQPSRFWSEVNGYWFDNAEIIRWLKRYPKYLVGMGCVEMGKNPDPPEKVDELKEQGFSGLKFIYSYYPYNHEIYFPIYARAEKLGMPILFHTGFLSMGDDGEDGKYGIDSNNYRPILLDRIARAFPRLKIIGAHLRNEEGITMMMSHRNIYFDFSATGLRVYKHLSPAMPDADMTNPRENPALNYFKKICFGTDTPNILRCIEFDNLMMDKLGIPQETREMFYWKNACEIFGWSESDLEE